MKEIDVGKIYDNTESVRVIAMKVNEIVRALNERK